MAAAHSSDLAAAASARATCGHDPTREGEQQEQGAAPSAEAAPIVRLYRHALESIFAFLPLADLSRVLSVSRLWSSAVRSMKPIDASLVTRLPLEKIAASHLASHIGELNPARWMSSSDLLIVSRHFRSLTSLSCTVELARAPRVDLGATLRSLTLELLGGECHTPIINDAIVVVSGLPQLTDLTLELPAFVDELSFAPLATATQLQHFKLSRRSRSNLAPDQLDQLRMLPQLRTLSIARLSNDGLASLLRLPHSLQWQQIHQADEIDDDAASALSSLPTLTALDTYNCHSVAFLPSLPRLRTLDLHMESDVRLAADIAVGLSCCPELTELTLSAVDVTSQHLKLALTHIPLLRTLKMVACDALESLAFLSECAHLAQSLQSLFLHSCLNDALHASELKHVLTLKNLVELVILRSFVEPPDANMLDSLKPPSSVLPALTKFVYRERK